MEKKGARKEIRKDTAFLAAQKAAELRAKDADRRQKTKDLLNSLANQEGDYQKLQRKKKKKFWRNIIAFFLIFGGTFYTKMALFFYF